MQRHEYFEELCSLAILGDLSAQELEELSSHLRICRECQTALAELHEISAEQLPLARSHRSSKTSPTQKIREAAIQRLVQEGLRITPEAMRGPSSWKQSVRSGIEEFRWVLLARRAQVGLIASAILVACALGVMIRRDRAGMRQVQLQREEVSRKPFTPPVESVNVVPQSAPADSALEVAGLRRDLAEAKTRIARIESDRVAAQKSLDAVQAELTQVTADNTQLHDSVGSRDNELASLRGQLEQMRSKLNASDAELAAAHYQVTSLTAELKNDQAAFDREKELLAAGKDVRDLMGARNLHIIDVHDTDARGEERPFGRIFLTEGKRLIFYAYDLDGAKVKNATFQAWGQRTDANRTAVNLGILYMDDQKQARWALKVEDASLLKTIDSLFVTVEPQGGAAKPTGKKLMYAYLRNPINHP